MHSYLANISPFPIYQCRLLVASECFNIGFDFVLIDGRFIPSDQNWFKTACGSMTSTRVFGCHKGIFSPACFSFQWLGTFGRVCDDLCPSYFVFSFSLSLPFSLIFSHNIFFLSFFIFSSSSYLSNDICLHFLRFDFKILDFDGKFDIFQ